MVVVVVVMGATWATETHNLQHTQILHDDQEASHQPPVYPADRKRIFINNKAYDMSEEEQARMWNLHLKKAHIPHTDTSVRNTDLDSPPSTMQTAQTSEANNDDQAVTLRTAWGPQPDRDVRTGDLEGNSLTYSQRKSTPRFVANPDKVHLIEVVGKDELEEMYNTTGPEAGERDVTESPLETVTVLYEATKVSVLSFIWTELKNIGELLGREMVDTLTARLSHLWRSVVKFVQARGRRSITHHSSEF